MKHFYCPSDRGFYTDEPRRFSSLPDDLVEITEQYKQELLDGECGSKDAPAKSIVPDENGYPILVDIPPLTDEELSTKIRARRNNLLKSSDWVILRAQETDNPIPQEWIDYRQALRDIPAQAEFPQNVTWPTEPAQ